MKRIIIIMLVVMLLFGAFIGYFVLAETAEEDFVILKKFNEVRL